MSDITEARNAVQGGMRMFKAFENSDAALTVLENFEQVERECKEAAEKAQADLAALKQQIADAQAEMADTSKKAEVIISDAQSKAKEIVMAANEEGKAAVAAAQAKVDSLTQNVVALKAERDEIVRLTEGVRVEYQAVEKRLAVAREAMIKALQE